MKTIFLLLLTLLIAGCASAPPPAVRVVYHDAPKQTKIEGVRIAETIKAYPMGRYIDPYNRRIMHEGHTVYRVETTPRWNLRPAGKTSAGQPGRSSPSIGASSAMTDELVMEVNRQRKATQAVIESGKTVSEKLAILTETLERAKEASLKNVHLQQEVEEIRRQIDALKQQQNQSSTTIQNHSEPAW